MFSVLDEGELTKSQGEYLILSALYAEAVIDGGLDELDAKLATFCGYVDFDLEVLFPAGTRDFVSSKVAEGPFLSDRVARILYALVELRNAYSVRTFIKRLDNYESMLEDIYRELDDLNLDREDIRVNNAL